MLIKRIEKRKEEERRRHTCVWRRKEKKRSIWGEKRKKERDIGVFHIRERGRRRRKRRETSVMKWRILVFLLGYFTDGFTNG